MIEPLIIRKCPDRYENLLKEVGPNEYKRIIDNVCLDDIINYIINLNTDSWVPRCYWINKGEYIFKTFRIGEFEWAIYSYLVSVGLLLVEDQYYGYNESRTEKYRGRKDYYNPLESALYYPIVERLLGEGYVMLDSSEPPYRDSYKISKRYVRERKLEQLGI